MSIGITVRSPDIAALAAAWVRAPELSRQLIGAGMQEVVLLLQREVSEQAPVGVTGELRNSVFSDVEGGLDYVTGVVGLTALHAEPIEFGTVAHTPPIEPLIDWVEARLGLSGADAQRVARAIQFKIRKHGTEANPFMQRAFDASTSEVRRILDVAVAGLVQTLALQ